MRAYIHPLTRLACGLLQQSIRKINLWVPVTDLDDILGIDARCIDGEILVFGAGVMDNFSVTGKVLPTLH
jgi:hypothetical protein